MDDPPPSYSESTRPEASQQFLSPRSDNLVPRKCLSHRNRRAESTTGVNATAQLSRWLLEIIAFTFEINTPHLDLNLSPNMQPPGNRPSILSAQEQRTLLRLAHILQSRRAKVLADDHEWYRLPNRDQRTLIRMIISLIDCQTVTDNITRPSKALELHTDYVLALISSYADHRCDPAARNLTLVAKRTPRFHIQRFFLFCHMNDLGDTLRMQTVVAARLAFNETVLKQLRDGMTSFRKIRKLQGLSTGSTLWAYEDTHGFQALEMALRHLDDQ